MRSYPTLSKILGTVIQAEFKPIGSGSIRINEDDDVAFNTMFEFKTANLTDKFDFAAYPNEEDLWDAISDFAHGEETRMAETVKASLKEKLTQGVKFIDVDFSIMGVKQEGNPQDALKDLDITVDINLTLNIPLTVLDETVSKALKSIEL
jgi:hypothetical protein